MKFKLGCDPELFVKNKAGALISAHGLVPGDKINPSPVDKGAVQVDGMALEYNIEPSESLEDFVSYNTSVLSSLKDMLPEDCDFDIKPVAEFGMELIQSQPEEARILGCEPDYNAYTGKVNVSPNAELDFRTASGHIHIGWTEDQDIHSPEHFYTCCLLTQLLDKHLAAPALLLEPRMQGVKRRKLYGKAGAFRPKPYGMEYRVLSNFWIKNPKLMAWVYNKVEDVMNNVVPVYKDTTIAEAYNGSGFNLVHGGVFRKVINREGGWGHSLTSVATTLKEYRVSL